MKTYIAIDLKSFYASVECIERNLDPLTTNLVVADASKTEKTICLAVSPSMKQYGIPGRARLFEVVQKVKEINRERLKKTDNYSFNGKSIDDSDLKDDPNLELDYIAAPPRMAHYLQWSTKIHEVYLKYIAPEDIHVYSIDEVFIDATHYLNTYHCTPKELAMKIILDILDTTGITATAGIGDNLYLCKIAMDIMAKHVKPDKNGVRIAYLDEMSYRKNLWDHQPITDFWRVGRGYQKRLASVGLYTMGDIARCSLGKDNQRHNEALLYELFGINGELLIDHAWGYESTTMKDIKAYKPQTNSIGRGQVLGCAYIYEKVKLVVKEMIDGLALELVDKGLVCNCLILTIGYDKDNIGYQGEMMVDVYGRKLPKQAHGTIRFDRYLSSSKMMIKEVMKWMDKHVNKSLLVKRINISVGNVVDEKDVEHITYVEQLDLFSNSEEIDKKEKQLQEDLEKERKLQLATLKIKKKYGKNSLLKGMDLEEGATAKERNGVIGGHKA